MNQSPSPSVVNASNFVLQLYEQNLKLTNRTCLLNQMELQNYLSIFLQQLEERGVKNQNAAVDVFNKKLSNLYKEEGNLYLKNKSYATAVDLYIASCLISPENPIYFSNLAAALFFCKRYKESEKACEIAIQLDSNYGKAYSRLAKVKEKLGKFNEAIDNYNKAIELETNKSNREAITEQRDELIKTMKK
ncbi:hypothetical protein ABK040_003921 [Willaertia magna]